MKERVVGRFDGMGNMELLRKSYASSSASEESSSDDDAKHEAPLRREHQDPPLRVSLSNEELKARREAIAKRFHERSERLTRPTTHQARGFAYQPYISRRKKNEEAHASHSETIEESLFSNLELTSLPTRDEDTDLDVLMSPPQRRALSSHSGAINCIAWNRLYPQLFLSASMDHTIALWTTPRSRDQDSSSVTPSRVLRHHTKGVKSATWSIDGRCVFSGGYDGVASVTDAEHNSVLQTYKASHDNEFITSVCSHPTDNSLFLYGSSYGRIYQRDCRAPPSSPPIVFIRKGLGDIHDLLFLPTVDSTGGPRFVSSCGVRARDSSHQTLLVWDLRSTALLFDNLDQDFHDFPCLRLHPNQKLFVAQSSANHATVFSAQEPYKRLRSRKSKRTHRFHGAHSVQGYSVRCSFNASGSVFATGDANGHVAFYDMTSHQMLRRHLLFKSSACLVAEFHPMWSPTLVAASHDGALNLFHVVNSS